MPRGSREGSTIIIPEVRDLTGRRIITPEKIYVRKRYKDPLTGKVREKKRLVENRKALPDKRHELVDEIKRDRIKPISIAQHDFQELAKFYKKEYLKPARYVNGVRVEGLRSWRKLEEFLAILQREFDPEPLSAITYERILKFKKRLLATPVVLTRSPRKIAKGEIKTRPRGIVGVNRLLRLLHRMLEIARRRLKWIPSNPFEDGDASLIQISLEQERMIILTREEEQKLLEQCTGPREHLKLALLWAIDTAMRPSEQFSTPISDVHLKERYITVRSYRAKREKDRIVPITARLAMELEMQIRRRNGDRSALVFDRQRMKRAWTTARRLAGLTEVRWQDLRHTGIMRMLDAGVSEAKVKKITGHTNDTTFMRYVNLNPEMAREIAKAMDQNRMRS